MFDRCSSIWRDLVRRFPILRSTHRNLVPNRNRRFHRQEWWREGCCWRRNRAGWKWHDTWNRYPIPTRRLYGWYPSMDFHSHPDQRWLMSVWRTMVCAVWYPIVGNGYWKRCSEGTDVIAWYSKRFLFMMHAGCENQVSSWIGCERRRVFQ